MPSIIDFELDSGVTLLRRTPVTLAVLLRDLPPGWAEATRGPRRGAPTTSSGHLIHGERTDWIPRVETIMRHGEAQPFERFDRFAQLRTGPGRTLDELLRELADLRAESLERLRALAVGPTDLARAVTHPELGRVTLRELLATWVAHDLDHLAQVARTMARQYARAVGPWRAYLPGLGD